MTNNAVTLAGVASDLGHGANGISMVTVNGVEASGDTAGNGGTANWSLPVSLSVGTNVFAVIACDASPNTNTTTATFAIYLLIDSDGDDIPDDWMVRYFEHPTGLASDNSRAQDDFDHDGLTNLREYQLGLNPIVPDRLYLQTLPSPTNGAFALLIGNVFGRSVTVEVSTNLMSWQTLTNLTGTNATIYFEDPTVTNAAQRFYRAVALNQTNNPAPPVVADFSGDPTNGPAPLTVYFTNLSSGATNYSWDFGDGNTSTVVSPTNIYTNGGSYTVSLTAIGPGGVNLLARTNYIVGTNAPPPVVADFTGSPTSGLSPLTVYFTNLTSGATSYSWDFGDGNTSTVVSPTNIYTNGGSYTVRLSAIGPGGVNLLARTNYIVTAPGGMVVIPAGSFTMGDTFGEGTPQELPLHTVYVSAFSMDKYEVTKALWDEVYNWATNHGYSFEFAADGKRADHPAQNMTWFDAVKWCNARSEKEGRVPAYYTNSTQTTVYRSGEINVENDWVKWNTGYRLPTEAEWEKAARGGSSGHRFPWSNVDTITHSQANYYSDSYNYAYDISPTQGYHPSFQAGGFPWTSPVGYFPTNGYGLCEMAGNVEEWCWDRGGLYSSSAQTDPRGPSSGSNRMSRGGFWGGRADYCRTASRDYGPPTGRSYSIGFRAVLPPGQ
jgi:PKD repeat protein